MNNSNENAVNSCFAHLTPHKQQVINNPTTGNENNITTDLKTVLQELHNQTNQMLTSAASIVDSNGTLTNPNFLECKKFFFRSLGFDGFEYDKDVSKPRLHMLFL